MMRAIGGRSEDGRRLRTRVKLGDFPPFTSIGSVPQTNRLVALSYTERLLIRSLLLKSSRPRRHVEEPHRAHSAVKCGGTVAARHPRICSGVVVLLEPCGHCQPLEPER